MDVYIDRSAARVQPEAVLPQAGQHVVSVSAADQPVHARGDRPGGNCGARQPQVMLDFCDGDYSFLMINNIQDGWPRARVDGYRAVRGLL